MISSAPIEWIKAWTTKTRDLTPTFCDQGWQVTRERAACSEAKLDLKIIKLDVNIMAYEQGSRRAGHTIQDISEEMMLNSSLAILVMTREDEQADGTLRERQNVIHEAGLFQG
jgi:predicted nucleotide-binding protein